MVTTASALLTMSAEPQDPWGVTGGDWRSTTSVDQVPPNRNELLSGVFQIADSNQGVVKKVVVELDKISFGKIDWNQVIDLTRNANEVNPYSNIHLPLQSQELYSNPSWYLTHSDLVPIINRFDSETEQFITEHELSSSIVWLEMMASDIFDRADIEIKLLPVDDGEESLLALKVYGDFSFSEFRERRHQICELMLSDNHNDLYDSISIFQRRVKGSGRKVFSCYSQLSAE